MKTYSIICDDGQSTMGSIKVNDDEMIVYDVCKIADYEGNDYAPRKAKELDFHMLQEMFNPKETDDGG